VEHVRVDPADSETAVIDGAPAVLEEPARPVRIVPDLQGISRYVEDPVLVAELGSRGRLEGVRVDLPDCPDLAVKEEDVPVEPAGAALRARGAAKADLPDDPGQAFQRVLVQAVAFRRQGGNPERDRG